MKTQAEIREAIERFTNVIQKKASAGRFTTATTVRSTGGMACEIEEGPWRFDCDMPEVFGGENTAPGPSFYGRAAIATCVASGIAKQFALEGLALDSVRVDVETDVDMSERLYPLTPFHAFRLRVGVETTAPEAQAKQLVEAAVEGSTWCGNTRTAFDVPAEMSINGKRMVNS